VPTHDSQLARGEAVRVDHASLGLQGPVLVQRAQNLLASLLPILPLSFDLLGAIRTKRVRVDCGNARCRVARRRECNING